MLDKDVKADALEDGNDKGQGHRPTSSTWSPGPTRGFGGRLGPGGGAYRRYVILPPGGAEQGCGVVDVDPCVSTISHRAPIGGHRGG